MTVFTEPQGSVLDYGFDWTLFLATSETISSQTWTCSNVAVSFSSLSIAAGITSAFVTGIQDGTTYIIKNTIITNQGRTESRVHTIICDDR